ncbi:MAG: energy-coupling factor ABC transporter ATP-binding protein [Bacillota bacterium]
MAEPIIKAEEITYSYQDGTTALDNLSLTIKEAEKSAILGPNGAGKSTLFLHLNGILQPESGRILFAGRQLKYNQSNLNRLREKIGLIFQDPDQQLFSASVYQELSFGPLNLGLSESEVKQRVTQILEETGLKKLAQRPTHHLSYGQKKKVAIASVLVMEPELIIFDEPTAGLDPAGVRDLLDFIAEIYKQERSILIATHDVDLAYAWADQIYLLEQGQIVSEGSPRDVFQQRAILEQIGLEQPWVIEVYNQLVQNGVLSKSDKLPTSKDELLRMIES